MHTKAWKYRIANGLRGLRGHGACALVALAILPGLAGATPANMSVADYLARKRQIDVGTRAAQAACGANPSSQREICLSVALGDDVVAKADLEVAYRSTPRTRFEATEARAQARYLLARERCADTAQALRSGCTRDARGERLAAQADATAVMRAAEADAVAAEACAATGANRAPSRAAACVQARRARAVSTR